jgi:hypothetical protein
MAKVLAKITYHSGKSCRIAIPGRPVVKFFQNRTVPVTDEEVIKRCENTHGFSVQRVDLHPKGHPAKKTKEPVETRPTRGGSESDAASEEKPKKKKKKTKRATY